MTSYTIDSHGMLHLPEGLTVGGTLDLNRTAITVLPEGLTVGGGLYLIGTAIKALPEGLTVGGDLDLRGTAVTALPDGLTVGGCLDLRGTAITVLPDGLTVGGDLYLNDTAITALPESIRIRGKTIADAPYVPNLDAAVYAAASQPGALDMSDWHCGTAHCWAGWITTLAGVEGRKFDSTIGRFNTAMLIYSRSCPGQPLPDFYCKNDEALADMARRAGRVAE
jgi:hypothetical protein